MTKMDYNDNDNADADLNEAIPDDLSETEDAQGYSLLAAGQYLARIVEIDPTRFTTKTADRMWDLTWQLVARKEPGKFAFEGKHFHRKIWDSVVFSRNTNAMKRRKFMFKRLGLNPDAPGFAPAPGMILGKWCIIDLCVIEDEYKGETRKKNKLKFYGFESVPPHILEKLATDERAPQVFTLAETAERRNARGGAY